MTKVESNPKMTVNKLGEYLVASPRRQRRILEQLKYPDENRFGAVAHSEAREAIKAYFVSGFDPKIILDCISLLKGKDPVNDYQEAMINSSVEGLELVLESEEIDKGLTYLPYEGPNPKLNLHGVEISVYPDLIVENTIRGTEFVGALKLHLSKNSSNTEEGDKYIAAILHMFGTEHLNSLGKDSTRPSLYLSYDIFADTFTECPKSISRRMEDINAGCLNIVAIWNSI